MNLDLRPVGIGIMPGRAAFRFHGGRYLGDVSPYLYSAPPGLVEFKKTPVVTQVDPDTGLTYSTGGVVLYPGAAAAQPSAGVYQAPAMVETPACTQANGGAFVSGACVDLALAVEAQNLQAISDANRRVFVHNCLAAGNSQADCVSRDYGQTPAGGYTSDSHAQGPQLYQDAAGNFVTPGGGAAPGGGSGSPAACQPGWHKNAAGNGCDIDAAPKTTAEKLAKGYAGGGGAGDQDDAGADHTGYYWIAGIAAVALIFVAVNR